MERPPEAQAATPQHFLFVTSPLHGHINPVRLLADRVAAANPGARVTFSTAVSGHRLTFPALARPDEEVSDGSVLHAPFSDGFDDGYDPRAHGDARSYAARAHAIGRETLSAVVARVGAARGRPVTRVVYTFLVEWALDVARDNGVPATLFWIMPATVLAVYYHYFHGHDAALLAAASCADGGSSVQLPGLPPLGSEALPTLVSVTSPEQPMYAALDALRHIFAALDADGGERRLTVLVNTFDALEPDALRAAPRLELVAVGPVVRDEAAASPSRTDDAEGSCGYMEWLGTKAARSVVYVSFGSLVPMSGRQAAEMRRALDATGRPYLWVRRGEPATGADQPAGGMVVAWCDQLRVLSHPAVGCFVTHCGWNSALESVACGVPVVAVPQWTDQPTVAWLLAEQAGVGVRATASVDDRGVVEHDEVRRCVEAVMGDGDGAAGIRAHVERWREEARSAVVSGGRSDMNLRDFASGL